MTRRHVLGVAMAAVTVAFPTAAIAQGHEEFERAWRDGTPTVVTGLVTTIYQDDFENNRAALRHLVRDERTGQTFTLRFSGAPPAGLRANSGRFSLSGRSRGSELYVLAATTATDDGPTANITALSSSATSTGEQHTLVMLANFRDAAVACSADAVDDMMFSDPNGLSVNELYRNASQGAVSFSGQVVGPFTISASNTDTCDIGGWATSVEREAALSGVDIAAYPRKVYVMPPNSCPGAGFGTVGGSTSGAWVFSCNVRGIYAHELGHNLGMDHASTLTAEYGDYTDPMSSAGTRLRGLNAPHLHQLGWLQAGRLEVVNQSGIYEMTALGAGSEATAPQALILPKRDTDDRYYVSYRVPQGFDAYIDSNYLDRISIHTYGGESSRTTRLAGLYDGESFRDEDGVVFTGISHSSTHAVVQIDLPDPCEAAPPAVTVTSRANEGLSDREAMYTVALTNLDSWRCAASSFALDVVALPGWTATLSASRVIVTAGATETAVLTVIPPTNVEPGTYTAIVRATDGTALHEGSASASYTVMSPCVPGPPSMSISPAGQIGIAGSRVSYTVTVSNGDSSACQSTVFAISADAPPGWSVTADAASFSVPPSSSATVLVGVTSAAAGAPGSYSVTITASDVETAGHSGSTQAFYTVLAPCVPEPPDIVSTPTLRTAAAGTTVTYTQRITNRDSGSCPAATFDVQPSVPPGWTANASPSTAVLAPGQSGDVLVSVTSPHDASVGTFDVPIAARDMQITRLASTSVTYVVENLDTLAPSAPTGLAAAVRQKQKQIDLTWNASIDNVAVVEYLVVRNGVPVAKTATPAWTDLQWVSGATSTYAVAAVDPRGNVSALSGSVTVTLSGSAARKR